MISFDAFVKAIHAAILGANDALMDRNVELLDRFFKEVPHVHDENDESASEAKDSGDSHTHVSHLPKSVCLIYPQQTASGKPKMVSIHVPLITLVPLSMSQIEKVKFTADFEIHMCGDELQLKFPSGGSTTKRGIFSRKARETTTGKLEITITPHSVSEGIKLIVEGYERALRAQIPQ